MKRLKHVVTSAFAVATVLSAFISTPEVAAQQRSNRGNQRPQIRPATPRAEALARSRAELVREVRRELATLPYYDVFDFLQFEVRSDNTVVLSGQTTRPSLKRDAEERIKDIEGISRVVNNIEVLPVSPQDERIRVAVYRELFNFDSPLYRYSLGAVPPIRIIVNRGRLTLRGIVATEADKNLAGIRANGVPGIFEVRNELEVEDSRPR